MAINTSTFESTLQTKLNAVSDAKEMLLLGKALESTVGSIAVSDINTAGATQVSAINTVATSTFKTVGGASILGSGDIATLPSGGTADQVLTSDASSNGTWQDVVAPANAGVAWLEYIDNQNRFAGLYSVVGAQGTNLALLPFNTVTDPHNIVNTSGSNSFTVHTDGVYSLEGYLASHNDAHHTGVYIYSVSDATFAPRPNSTFDGESTWCAPNIGYDSTQDPQGTPVADLVYLKASKTYQVRWSNENNSTGLGSGTTWLWGNYTNNAVQKKNTLMRLVLTKLGGY